MAAIKRSDSLRVKVSPGMKERIERLSHLLGVPPSTIAALAVGQYVANMERSIGAVDVMAQVMGDQVGGELGAEIKRQIGLFSKENLSP